MNILEIAIAVLAPFIYIVLLTGLFIYIFKKKYNFQTVLPLALISVTLFVFFFTAVFHTISVAFWLTVVASLAFIPLVIFDKNRLQFLKEKVFTPGFVIFCILYIFVVALSWFKVIPLLSDSSMHWAPHVWTMWLRDDFYTSPGISIVIHGDYPPIVQLFELIWSKAASVYREGLLIAAIIMLSFSMLMPAFGKFVWQKGQRVKDWLLILVLSGVVLILPMIFFVSDFYSTLEVDTILAFMFAYGIYLAATESKKFTVSGVVKLALLITFMCLAKQVAILLAGLIGIIYLAGILITYRKSVFLNVFTYLKRWKKHWLMILVVVFAGLLPIVSMRTWSAQTEGYVSPDAGVAIFHLDPLDTLKIPDILTQQAGSEAQQNFSRSYIQHILFDPAGLILNNAAAISYLQIVILFVGAMMLIWLIHKNKLTRQRIVIIGLVMTAGWFLYTFAIYAVFLFGGMNDFELNRIDTSNRYLRTYLFAMLLIVVILLIKRILDSRLTNRSHRPLFYVTLSLCILLGAFFNKDTLGSLGIQSTINNRAQLTALGLDQTESSLDKIESVSNSSFDDPTKILVTASTDDERHYLQYNALPSRISVLLLEKQPNQELVCNRVKEAEYVVVGYDYPDDNKWQIVNECLLKDATFAEGDIYRVQNTSGELYLEKVL